MPQSVSMLHDKGSGGDCGKSVKNAGKIRNLALHLKFFFGQFTGQLGGKAGEKERGKRQAKRQETERQETRDKADRDKATETSLDYCAYA